jgi:hypothetical protein
MGIIDRILGREEGQASPDEPAIHPAQSVIVTPRRPFVHKPALHAAGLRTGMWVATSDGDIGILTGCGIDSIGEVTLVKGDGTDRMMLDENDKAVSMRAMKRLETLRQAYIEEIPSQRRPDVDSLRRLGYRNQPGAI